MMISDPVDEANLVQVAKKAQKEKHKGKRPMVKDKVVGADGQEEEVLVGR